MADLLWTLSIILGVVLGGLLLLWGKHSSSGWHGSSKSGARLPKGSLGWPFIGESFTFGRDPATFASSHAKRFGKIFKTSLFGQPVIMGLTPEFSKFIISNNSSGVFVSGFSASLKRLFGPRTVLFLDGPRHMSIKKVFQKPLLPDGLRTKVETLETIVLENLASWEKKGSVIGRPATEKITMDIGVWLIIGLRHIDSTAEGRTLMENMEILDKAQFSVPVNLPGTNYNKGLKVYMNFEPIACQYNKCLNGNSVSSIMPSQAKAALKEHFKYLVERRKGQANSPGDMLGSLLAAQEDAQVREELKDLDIDMIVDNLIFIWFAAYDTTSNSLLWILKLLADNPEVFRRVQAEQQEILEGKDQSAGGPRLSWEDTKKMVYTNKFLNEVHRTISLAFIQLRRATRDVEFEGHLIPKGWAVGWMQVFIHSDPELYPNPEVFNPNRFDSTPKPHWFLPFSAGPHLCMGMESSKLISLIFIHHLTTSYIYESAGPDRGTEYNSFLQPVGGYPINIRRRN